ncbi:MurR/RpiR family transcriptional regulator [Couchioplanes caeruleus]|uniref:Transcriptional regulator n=2 Tax=Couchioplanes caeruleus TaxID=56438 RepID=A0A1K0FDQ5_9ACTN|nr:MurR/RpiR family transcriptional regulator [Couchioplanes caeruleus]OJF10945.1 transcriptional regulator [Couchioplanes caeruleus subsp. caeruleus]ROP29884.1 RpiR family transcriptional regulator [Couchioplanes caeruleus]
MNEAAVGTGGRVLGLFQGARLTPTQRRIAHSLVQHGPSAAYLSAAEVAELAGVSQPSVTRFAMALGYAGYPALRRELRALAAVPATPPETGENPMQDALRAETRRLERMADELGDLSAVERAAQMLVGSRPLPVLGLRAAAPLAGYFGYFAAKVHPDVRVLDGGGTILLDRLDQARAAGASAVLAIVLPRYPRETLEAIREAKELGLAVVALTDSAVSPVAEAADVVLPAPVGTQLVFDLHTGPMAMAMVLLQAMCDAAPETAQRRLEEFEATANRRHIFEA